MQLDQNTFSIALSLIFTILSIIVWFQSKLDENYKSSGTLWSKGTFLVGLGFLIILGENLFELRLFNIIGTVVQFAGVILNYHGVQKFRRVEPHSISHWAALGFYFLLATFVYIFLNNLNYLILIDSAYLAFFFLITANQFYKISQSSSSFAIPAITLGISGLLSIVRFLVALFDGDRIGYNVNGVFESMYLIIVTLDHIIWVFSLILIVGTQIRKNLSNSNKNLQDALNANVILMKEMNHRIKNNLATVQSLLSLQAKSTDNHEARDILKESENRINSIARIHGHLTQKENLTQVQVDQYIKTIIDDIKISFKHEHENIEIKYDLLAITLDMDQVTPICLIFNELVSNSFKYAFHNQKSGIIQVSLVESGVNELMLLVVDNGSGFEWTSDDQEQDSFGLMIVKSLVNQLGGTINFESMPDIGTNIQIVIPQNIS